MEAGLIDIVNTDISKVVIDHMREIHTENKAMTWVVDDAVSMAFDDCSFDQIVDMSLLDCMCHCEDTQFEGCVNDFVRECHRVLRPSQSECPAQVRSKADGAIWTGRSPDR